jgi:hypothetical protein
MCKEDTREHVGMIKQLLTNKLGLSVIVSDERIEEALEEAMTDFKAIKKILLSDERCEAILEGGPPCPTIIGELALFTSMLSDVSDMLVDVTAQRSIVLLALESAELSELKFTPMPVKD